MTVTSHSGPHISFGTVLTASGADMEHNPDRGPSGIQAGRALGQGSSSQHREGRFFGEGRRHRTDPIGSDHAIVVGEGDDVGLGHPDPFVPGPAQSPGKSPQVAKPGEPKPEKKMKVSKR